MKVLEHGSLDLLINSEISEGEKQNLTSSATLKANEYSHLSYRKSKTSSQNHCDLKKDQMKEWFDQPKDRYKQQYSDVEERILRLRKIAETSLS